MALKENGFAASDTANPHRDFKQHKNTLSSNNGTESLFTKAIERYNAWKRSEASRIGGPYSIGQILQIMFGDEFIIDEKQAA